MLQELKKTMRKQVRQLLRQLTSEEKEQMSHILNMKFLESNYFKQSTHICCYVPMLQEEVNTLPIIHHVLQQWNEKKQLYVPVMIENDIQMLRVESEEDFATFESNNPFGILEPPVSTLGKRSNLLHDLSDPTVASRAHVLVVTPGLAFDRYKRRLGRGKGYYDRFIKVLRSYNNVQSTLIALAFDCQIVEQVPVDPTRDQNVDVVITPNATYLS
jgi:5-formyltetrahydrofolate cyclo-ligase